MATAYIVHNNYLAQRLGALEENPRPGQPRMVTPDYEARVTRIGFSQAPEEHARWSVSLINGHIIYLG